MSGDQDSPIVGEWGRHRRPPRRVRVPPWAWAALAVAVLVGGGVARILAVHAHGWRPPSGTPHFVSCTYGGYVTAWCANLRVPEDPTEPRGRSITLRVAVLPATRHPAVGALFYLEGGPGGAATRSAILVNGLFAEIERDRDVVMVDQRGTGGSRGGSARLYTSEVAADDLEAVRRGLGYTRIDVFGGSYGATLAQVFLHRHPASVRSVVLSSASLTTVRLYDLSARNAERALDAVVARCAASPPCHRAFPNTRRELTTVLARGAHRVTTPLGPVLLRPDDVAWIVSWLTETPSGASTLPFAINAAAHGDYLQLAEVYASDLGKGRDPLERLPMFWEIVCVEPWAGIDPAATARAGAGSYLVRAAVDRARRFRNACRTVPKGRVAASDFTASPTHVPVLMLSGGADPLDPPSNLRGWRHVFPNGRLVVVPGGGHGTMDSQCVQTIVARFVARASTRGLDASCARRVSLPPFSTG
jgi:pimeloyl-ACP methyl ester carboxylesterase